MYNLVSNSDLQHQTGEFEYKAGNKMKKTLATGIVAAAAGFMILAGQTTVQAENNENEEYLTAGLHVEKLNGMTPRTWPESIARFTFDSGYTFAYPDAVRGIFVTGHSAGGSRMDSLLELTDTTDLNAMVIDIKDDDGYLTYRPEDEDDFYYDISQRMIKDPHELMSTLEEHEIYPIARIVVFKDTVLAEKRPDLSFTQNGEVWKNRRGEAFVNPFMKEVWEYNVEIAKRAAEMGFQDIQFDYVRFPEGFENRDDDLDYDVEDYMDSPGDNVQRRVDAVTDFVAYAREELEPYDVDVSVDIFGYAATIEQTPGIGQNFSRISENVDVISSMIYPSHWGPYFGIDKPDLYPYELIDEYSQVENEVLGALDDPPVSRPWIQDFTASYLGSGNYLNYGKSEVEAQIQALYDNDIHEFLLWNAGNRYTENVDYMLDLDLSEE
ncbi:putative glycoside hydrolase [Salisediminibacterium beveridgei]|uniref:Putative glycoside hydrolase n=2 Tax=Salisediminibacterium beveridgei TaxID=632773 RepID=A0A1D7QWJ9_9BACI|nr:putative glycoside hydrolase [Salisediminibacterium beveridgei]